MFGYEKEVQKQIKIFKKYMRSSKSLEKELKKKYKYQIYNYLAAIGSFLLYFWLDSDLSATGVFGVLVFAMRGNQETQEFQRLIMLKALQEQDRGEQE